MRFELDEILLDEILFYMENQDGDFLIDTREGQVISTENYEGDDEPDFYDDDRFISLPEWSPNDGFRMMEHFAASLRSPVVREELSSALNKGRGVFRLFKNVLEQYPETEKLWFNHKEREMKRQVIEWYNSYREIWGLELIGSEPEDTSALILEDFILREGIASDAENAAALHRLCAEKDKAANNAVTAFEESSLSFPGDLCFTAETKNGDFSGYICAVKKPSSVHIFALEVVPEYRGLGLGKALLSHLIEKTEKQGLSQTTIDLPSSMENFSRTLRMEGFEPCVQRFVKNNF